MKKVLLIDDDLIYLKITSFLFKKFGENEFEISICQDIRNLEDKILNFDLDLIFLDINMPNKSGWEVLRDLENLLSDEHLPDIYMCSSSIDCSDVRKAESNNLVKGYIEKPIRKQEIYNLINEKSFQPN